MTLREINEIKTEDFNDDSDETSPVTDIASSKNKKRKGKVDSESQSMDTSKDYRLIVNTAKRAIDSHRIELAEALYHIHGNDLWRIWGYDSWTEYVVNEFEGTKQTASALMAIWHWFFIHLGSKMKPAEFKKFDTVVRSMSITKLKSLVGVVGEDDYMDWKEKADTLNSQDFHSMAQLKLKGEKTDDNPEDGKEELRKVYVSLIGEQILSMDLALEIAEKKTGSKKRSNNFAIIFDEFNASNSDIKDIPSYLSRVCENYQLNIIAFDKENGSLVFGEETLSIVTEKILSLP